MTSEAYDEANGVAPPGLAAPETAGTTEPDDGQSPNSELAKQAESAYLRDLPTLLIEHEGKWVAYHGGRQVGVSTKGYELHQQCLQQGLKPEEFEVFAIVPTEEAMLIGGMFMEEVPADDPGVT